MLLSRIEIVHGCYKTLFESSYRVSWSGWCHNRTIVSNCSCNCEVRVSKVHRVRLASDWLYPSGTFSPYILHNLHFVCPLQADHNISGMQRLSGLQRDVLALYRRSLRAARLKPPETRPNFESFARRELEKSIHLDKKDFGAIEFLLRKGERQLEMYASSNITDVAG